MHDLHTPGRVQGGLQPGKHRHTADADRKASRQPSPGGWQRKLHYDPIAGEHTHTHQIWQYVQEVKAVIKLRNNSKEEGRT